MASVPEGYYRNPSGASLSTENVAVLSEHGLHPADGIPQIPFERRMAAQETAVTIGQQRVQFRRHPVDVGTYGVLYVVPLALAAGELIYAEFLVEETVGLFYDSPFHGRRSFYGHGRCTVAVGCPSAGDGVCRVQLGADGLLQNAVTDSVDEYHAATAML